VKDQEAEGKRGSITRRRYGRAHAVEASRNAIDVAFTTSDGKLVAYALGLRNEQMFKEPSLVVSPHLLTGSWVGMPVVFMYNSGDMVQSRHIRTDLQPSW
jgi:hypothetical protein